MASTTKRCFHLTSLLLLLLLASTVYGAQLLADVKDAGADDKRVATRERVAGGHAHGYSGHNAHNPNGGPENGGAGTPAVYPRNLAARGYHQPGAASKAPLHARLQGSCVILGAIFLVLLV